VNAKRGYSLKATQDYERQASKRSSLEVFFIIYLLLLVLPLLIDAKYPSLDLTLLSMKKLTKACKVQKRLCKNIPKRKNKRRKRREKEKNLGLPPK